MAERDRPHIFLADWASSEPYTSHPAGGGRAGLPERDRARHGGRLREAFERETQHGVERRDEAAGLLESSPTGIQLTFESFPEVELALESLENRQLKTPAEVVAVRTEQRDEGAVQLATVFLPDEAIGAFIRRLESYLTEETPGGDPRYHRLIDPIEQIRLATLRELWTEATAPFPDTDGPFWWEVWLRRDEGRELDRFLRFADAVGARVGPRRLAFDDRTVVIAHATAEQLSQGLAGLDDLAELRQARVPSEFFALAPPAEQAEWIDDLLARTSFTDDDAPRVCLLDTGVRGNHPLLRPALDPADVHSVDPAWGTADDTGHGTEMAGLALYGGSLAALFASDDPVIVAHALESVKILPRPPAANDPDLYGAITAEAVSRAEVQRTEPRRAFSMAVSAAIPGPRPGQAYGQPTSWSSAVDALAVGRSFVSLPEGLGYLDAGEPEHGRLVLVAAGNIDQARWELAHLDRSDLEPVDDPAQAWNALTVGAYTELTDPGEHHAGHQPVSPAGELSPYSRTSVPFDGQWPAKPDVLLEGGNLAASDAGQIDTPESMQLVTTHGAGGSRLLTVTNATSAATAQAANMAAQVWAEYPDLWTQTVRGLIVHGARWTEPMDARFRQASSRKAKEALLRRYGFGVPTLSRVLRSASNELALVAEGTIHPFEAGQFREMHLYELPWPLEELEALGETIVQLRVTLSYFVEPNPSRRGWVGRFRYGSHGLRFEVKLPTESVSDLRKWLNKEALTEEERRPRGRSGAAEWLLGPTVRHRGSIHTDVWSGTAAALAARGVVAVYPVAGWWKQLKKRDRSDAGVRYSLIVSIEAPDVEVDLWTPVQAQVVVPVETEITA